MQLHPLNLRELSVYFNVATVGHKVSLLLANKREEGRKSKRENQGRE